MCGDDDDEMMKKKTGREAGRGERERDIKAQCEHLRDLGEGYPELFFFNLFLLFF